MGMVTRTLVRVECDRCGEIGISGEDAARVIKLAKADGWIQAYWLLGDKPRQTTLCPECVRQIVTQQALGQVDTK